MCATGKPCDTVENRMASAYTPGLTVAPQTVVRKTRRLPLFGEVLVRVGDSVSADQVVARTHLPGKVFPLNVANQLSILPDEVEDVMKKKVGDAVKEGELLAETRGFFGLFRSEVRSHIDGVVESISVVTGQVLLRAAPEPVEVRAYVDGTVVEELAEEGVIVETTGAFVQGIFGLGGEIGGALTLVARSPDEVVEPGHLRAEHRGQIVVGGSLCTLPALRRAIEVGVAGVVCGGFAYHDLRELLGRELGVAVTGGETFGTTLLVTEGFGHIAMAAATYELLAQHQGRRASMSGATQIRAGVIRPEIVIPGAGAAASSRPAEIRRGLDVGAKVRCVRAPYFGRLGTVVALPAPLARLPSETMARVVEVELAGGETIAIPRANVELIER
jgi:hypothetical protein